MSISGKDKSTILLSLLGPKNASAILKLLPPDLSKSIASSINNLPPPSGNTLNELFEEINVTVLGKIQTAKTPEPNKVIESNQPIAPAKAEQNPVEKPIKSEPMPSLPKAIKTFGDLDTEMLTTSLAMEKPQVAAFLLNQLAEEQREEIINRMQADSRQVVAGRRVFMTKVAEKVKTSMQESITKYWKAKQEETTGAHLANH